MGNPLEHAEHVAHAGHDHHDHHEPGHDPKASNLGTYIGITMATLGVLLAFCAAKVGGERTELVQSLVEQQNAHAKYQAQDIKHRVAVNNLRQLHAEIPLDADPQKPGDGRAPNKMDVLLLADTVDRYYGESQAAGRWAESYTPAINAHVEAQEHYETAQLFSEIGIVIASVALLLKRRVVWLVALALGIVSMGLVGRTYAHTTHAVHEAEHKIEETGKEYRELRNHGKMTDSDQALVEEMRRWAGKPADKAAPAPAPHGEHGEH